MNDQDNEVQRLLCENGIVYGALLIEQFTKMHPSDGHMLDKWLIRIGDESFDYYTALGYLTDIDDIKNAKGFLMQEGFYGYGHESFMIVPSAGKVISSLLSDAQSCKKAKRRLSNVFSKSMISELDQILENY